MEVEFDKEIDAILRNARRDSPAIPATRHLDADEISAFAENAMPEKSRSLYAAHMADCDRCRKILSDALVLNAEAVPAAAPSLSAITIAERSVPWYRNLFLFPNLAYVMGGLVLVFGGFLAFSVIQNSKEPLTAGISEQPSMPAVSTEGGGGGGGGPMLEESESMNANSTANTAANVAVPDLRGLANSNAASSASSAAGSPGGPRASDSNFVGDVSTADSSVPAAAPPPIRAAEVPTTATKSVPAGRDDLAMKSKNEDKEVQNNVQLQEPAKKDAMTRQQQAGVPLQSGPMDNQRGYNRQLENRDAQAKRAAKPAMDADGTGARESSGGRKVVSGRTFERKDGVWYDTKYQGHPTINVRRGSDEFNRLDAGLRGIANSLSGTIVVVWGSKAYRIQ